MKKSLIGLLLTFSLVFSVSANGANNDPLESLNRVFFSFNQVLDEAFIKPAAKSYEKIMPSFLKIDWVIFSPIWAMWPRVQTNCCNFALTKVLKRWVV